MKKLISFLLLIAVMLTVCGCQDKKSEIDGNKMIAASATNKNNNTNNTNDTKPSVPLTPGDGIPVLTIDTGKRAGNSLDFVTEPVTGFVSEMIASWTPGYVMPPAPYYEACKITLTDENGIVTLSNMDAEVKVRGNWTTTYAKKPLRLKFTEKQNLLGLNDGAEMKNWVLVADYKDASMLRNKSALSIAGEILEKEGLYGADSCFVEVVINDEYWGVYLLTEYQQINENRVNITEAEKDYTGTDIGYLLEFDGYNYTNENPWQSFWVSYADQAPLVPYDGQENSGRSIVPKEVPGFTIKNDIYSWEQHDFIASYVENVYRVMYAAAYEDKAYVFNSDYSGIYESNTLSPQEAVEQAVDVDSLAAMYIISELTCDADIYWSSFYMDADFGKDDNRKLTFEAPWDFDSAMGNKNRCADGIGFYAANIVWDVNDEYQSINPWLAVLAHEDWFQELVSEKWTAAYDSGVFERAYTMITEDAEKYSAAFERNYAKWNNIENRSEFGHELSWQAAQCRNQKEAAEQLQNWLKTRVEFLNEHWHK